MRKGCGSTARSNLLMQPPAPRSGSRVRDVLALRVMLISACLLMAVCTNPLGPDSRRVIGQIQPPSEYERVIIAPDSVKVGASFQVTVNSFGSSSCVKPDGVDLELSGSLAVVTPYDRLPAGNAICTADISPRPHPVALQFSAAGEATIRAVGYMWAQGQRVLGQVEHTLLVLP